MDPTVERVFSRLVEAELELVVGVERARFELAFGAVNGVRNIIMVDPSYLRARLYDDRARSEGELVDLNFGF